MREATNITRKSVSSKANSPHQLFPNSFLHISSLAKHSNPLFKILVVLLCLASCFCFSFFLLGQNHPNSAKVRLMAQPRYFPYGLIALSGLLLLSLTSLPAKSVGSALHESAGTSKQQKSVLGSRPPLCVNKCLNCSPCMATLVVPPHMKSTEAKLQEDESYYLVSWKCRCGNKLFQP